MVGPNIHSLLIRTSPKGKMAIPTPPQLVPPRGKKPTFVVLPSFWVEMQNQLRLLRRPLQRRTPRSAAAAGPGASGAAAASAPRGPAAPASTFARAPAAPARVAALPPNQKNRPKGTRKSNSNMSPKEKGEKRRRPWMVGGICSPNNVYTMGLLR